MTPRTLIYLGVYLFSFCCWANIEVPLAALDRDAIHLKTMEVLRIRRPSLNLGDFYLQRITHQIILSHNGEIDLDTIDAIFRLRTTPEAVKTDHDIIAIRAEFTTDGAIRKLLLIPRNGNASGAIVVPLDLKEEDALMKAGLLKEGRKPGSGIKNKLYESEHSKTNRIDEAKQESAKSSKCCRSN